MQIALCKINRLFLAFFCEYWYNKDRSKSLLPLPLDGMVPGWEGLRYEKKTDSIVCGPFAGAAVSGRCYRSGR